MNAIISQAARPVMAQYQIPGMEIGIVQKGQSHIYDFGVADKATGHPVNATTLFEIGSVSKIFAATLTAYLVHGGALSLNDKVSAQLPALQSTGLGDVTLLELGTYTPGGMPLTVPDKLKTDADLISYLQDWKPAYPPSTVRTYSNLSLGLLGFIAARSMKEDYASIIQNRVFPALGLHHSYMDVPPDEMAYYAQGYRRDGRPVRQVEDILGPEAYGVRTNAADLLHVLEINMTGGGVDPAWRRAALTTHTSYFRVNNSPMIQDLVWEQLELPVSLAALRAANSDAMGQEPHPVTAITPPAPPRADVLLNKTGSTNGFASYVAFIPTDDVGIVILANRNYPNAARVTLAYEILSKLDPHAFSHQY